MTRLYVVRGRTVLAVLTVAALGLFVYAWDGARMPLLPVVSEPDAASGPGGGRAVTFHIVTGEFKTRLPDGKEIEAYRWDPGTVVVRKGDRVTLHFHGVNGAKHPFEIRGYNVRGTVEKGKQTTVQFVADRAGTFEIVCLTHPDRAHHGPMVGYLHVLER
ncbi:MAG TPA: cupredoxin domain-containing protein [Calditerricola sp.]